MCVLGRPNKDGHEEKRRRLQKEEAYEDQEEDDEGGEGGSRGEQEGAGQPRDAAPQQAATRRPHYRSHWHSTKKLAERRPAMNAEGR